MQSAEFLIVLFLIDLPLLLVLLWSYFFSLSLICALNQSIPNTNLDMRGGICKMVYQFARAHPIQGETHL